MQLKIPAGCSEVLLPAPREKHLPERAARGPELSIRAGTHFNQAGLLAAPRLSELSSSSVTRRSEYSRSLFFLTFVFPTFPIADRALHGMFRTAINSHYTFCRAVFSRACLNAFYKTLCLDAVSDMHGHAHR